MNSSVWTIGNVRFPPERENVRTSTRRMPMLQRLIAHDSALLHGQSRNGPIGNPDTLKTAFVYTSSRNFARSSVTLSPSVATLSRTCSTNAAPTNPSNPEKLHSSGGVYFRYSCTSGVLSAAQERVSERVKRGKGEKQNLWGLEGTL